MCTAGESRERGIDIYFKMKKKVIALYTLRKKVVNTILTHVRKTQINISILPPVSR